MSTTTPSHIETIRFALNIAAADTGATSLVQRSAVRALASLEALSRQPEQAPDIEKIREHIWGIMRSIGSASIHEDPAKNKEYLQQAADRTKSALEFVRELKVQPAQTEDLEAKAREWVRKTYGLTLAANSAISFDTSEFVKLVAAFARSLSEPK